MAQLQMQPDDATLTQVLDGLAEQGYEGDFFIDDDGGICCGACGTCTPAGDAVLDGLRRIEGASDPADMAAVLAVTCPRCGAKGTAVVRYGPEAGPGDAEVLLAIDDHRPRGTDVAEDASHTEPEASGAGASGEDAEVEPDEPVGDFGGPDQSDAGGDSDVDLTSDG
jgi:hypothetical protein